MIVAAPSGEQTGLRIAIVRNDLTVVDPSRYNSQELGLARGLSALGHEVDVYTVSGNGKDSDQEIQERPTRIRFRFVRFRRIPVLEAPVFVDPKRWLGEGRYDFVQINDEGSLAARQIAGVCVRLGVPYGIYQGMYELLQGRSRALFERFHARLSRPYVCRYASVVLTKTDAAARFLQDRGYTRTITIPVGLDRSVFENREANDWTRDLSSDPSDRFLIYVGSIERRRNPLFLLDVLEELDVRFRLLIVGDGPQHELLEREANARLPGRVHLLGSLRQQMLPEAYELASCFLLPTSFEIYGMVVLESLLFGCPVISSPAAGPNEILTDSRLGAIVPLGEPAAWAKAVTEIVERDAGDPAAATFRRNLVSTRYDWTAIAKRYLNALEST